MTDDEILVRALKIVRISGATTLLRDAGYTVVMPDTLTPRTSFLINELRKEITRVHVKDLEND